MAERKTLVLHVGLPKTGTSALQRWCNTNRDSLRRRGVDYPAVNERLIDPKHQFLIGCLHANKFDKLEEILAHSSAQTIVLSTEGITNHFYDFPESSLKSFRRICEHYLTIVFLVARDPVSWTRSYYNQAVINPPIPKYHYATALAYEEFCQLPRIQRLTDIRQLRMDLQDALGATRVDVAHYETDWMATFLSILDISPQERLEPLTEENRSVSRDLVELLRQVNGMGLSIRERAHFIAAVSDCFQSNHRVLNSYKQSRAYKQDGRPPRIDRILARLVAHTPEQGELIDRLSKWLNEGNVPLPKTGSTFAASPLEWLDT